VAGRRRSQRQRRCDRHGDHPTARAGSVDQRCQTHYDSLYEMSPTPQPRAQPEAGSGLRGAGCRSGRSVRTWLLVDAACDQNGHKPSMSRMLYSPPSPAPPHG
jgi:hypothetical protein